jgi:predicted lipid-binding transport protein (Tim44 family)
MGHSTRSNHAFTTYQAPDRAVDASGSRFGEAESAEFAAASAAHSSVSWNRTKAAPNNIVFENAHLQTLVEAYKVEEKKVQAKFGVAEVSDLHREASF